MGHMEGTHCLWRLRVEILFMSVLKADTFLMEDKNLYYFFEKNGVCSSKNAPVMAILIVFLDSFHSSSALWLMMSPAAAANTASHRNPLQSENELVVLKQEYLNNGKRYKKKRRHLWKPENCGNILSCF